MWLNLQIWSIIFSSHMGSVYGSTVKSIKILKMFCQGHFPLRTPNSSYHKSTYIIYHLSYINIYQIQIIWLLNLYAIMLYYTAEMSSFFQQQILFPKSIFMSCCCSMGKKTAQIFGKLSKTQKFSRMLDRKLPIVSKKGYQERKYKNKPE